MTFLLTRDGDPARRRRSWPVMACLLLALPFPGNTTAMDNEHTPAQQDVAPETTIGEGSQSRRPVIRDPVTGVAWADKPYHVTVYGHDGTGTVLDLAGTTDDQGRTAHLRVPEQTGRQDIMAVPVIGEGDYAIRARMTRPSGQPAAHHGYVLVLANGAVFMGKADETGHVAMVHTVEPTEVVLRMQYFPDSDAWQAQAEALNDTVRTHDYAKRLAIYRQQFAAAPWENHEDAGLLDAEALAGPLLTTAAHTTSEDFESAARRYVSIRALARARKNIQADPDIDAAASENPEDYIGSAARLSAHLDLLARMADLSGPAIPPAFITELGEETVALLDDLEPVDLRRTDHRIMTASQQLMHDGHEQTAAEVFRASGYLQRRGSSIDGDDLAFAALVADILGDDDRSRQLMSYANVASRLSYELGEADAEDPIAGYRHRLPKPAVGMMLVSAHDLERARAVCVLDDRTAPVAGLYVVGGPGNRDGLDLFPAMQGLDKLLSQGRLQPGDYEVKTAGCDAAGDAATRTVSLDRDTLDRIRSLKLFHGFALYSPEAMKKLAHGNSGTKTDAAGYRSRAAYPTAIQIMAFLQNAAAAPGIQAINKLHLPEEIDWSEMRLF